jgi:hypothetical protein
MQRPGRFTPGRETRCPFYRRLGGPQVRSGRVRKISPPPGFLFFLLYSILHPYLFLHLYCPAFCLTTQTSIFPAGFEPATPTSDRPKTFALDRSPTGIGSISGPSTPWPVTIPTALSRPTNCDTSEPSYSVTYTERTHAPHRRAWIRHPCFRHQFTPFTPGYQRLISS